MNKRLESTLSLLVTLSALAVAGIVVIEHVRDRRTRVSVSEQESVENWQELLARGTRIGLPSAPLQIVEFGDFQCPFCKSFHADVERLLEESDGTVALTYIHFPLQSHAHAGAAARAADCAADQSRFQEMASALFANQDSIGIRAWSSYAIEARVGDLRRFESCVNRDSLDAEVSAHRDYALQNRIDATPTVIVNATRYRLAPSIDSLRTLLELAKRQPLATP